MEELQELEKTKKLTPKQEAFCQEYIISMNATKSYQKVYGTEYESSRRLGSKLLSNVDIASRIKELQEEIRKEFKLEVEDMVYKAMEIYNLARDGKPEVKLDIKGKPVKTGNIDRDLRAANDALKSIGTWLGLNSTNVKAEVEAKTEVNVVTAKDVIDELIGS